MYGIKMSIFSTQLQAFHYISNKISMIEKDKFKLMWENINENYGFI